MPTRWGLTDPWRLTERPSKMIVATMSVGFESGVLIFDKVGVGSDSLFFYTSKGGGGGLNLMQGFLYASAYSANDTGRVSSHVGTTYMLVVLSYGGYNKFPGAAPTPSGPTIAYDYIMNATSASFEVGIEVEELVRPGSTGDSSIHEAAYRVKVGGRWYAKETSGTGISLSGIIPLGHNVILNSPSSCLATIEATAYAAPLPGHPLTATTVCTGTIMGQPISILPNPSGPVTSYSFPVPGRYTSDYDFTSGVTVKISAITNDWGGGSQEAIYSKPTSGAGIALSGPSARVGRVKDQEYDIVLDRKRLTSSDPIQYTYGFSTNKSAEHFSFDLIGSAIISKRFYNGFVQTYGISPMDGSEGGLTMRFQELPSMTLFGSHKVTGSDFGSPILNYFGTRPFKALKVVQAASIEIGTPAASEWTPTPLGATVVDVSGGGVSVAYGSGGTTRRLETTYPVSRRISAYRYFRFEVRSVGAANQACSLVIDNRTFNFTTGADAVWKVVDIDLMDPTSTTDTNTPESYQIDSNVSLLSNGFVTGYQETRFKNQVTNPPVSWGVDNIRALTYNFPDGSTANFEVRKIAVFRKTPMRLDQFEELSSSSGSTYNNERVGVGDTDGKRSFEFKAGARSGGGPISSWQDMVLDGVQVLGLTITEVEPLDPDWGYSSTARSMNTPRLHPPALDGTVYLLDRESDTVWAQCRAAKISVQPGMGDVFGNSPVNPVGPTRVYLGPTTGFAVSGIVYDNDRHPSSGALVKTIDAITSADTGSGTSDVRGRYRTGAPFARTEENVKVLGSVADVTIFHQIRSSVRRVSIRAQGSQPAPVHADISRVGVRLGVVVWCEDGHIKTKKIDGDRSLGDEITIDGVTDAEYAQVKFQQDGTWGIVYSNGTNCYYIQSAGWGTKTNWGTPVIIAPGKNPAYATCPRSKARLAFCHDGVTWRCYRMTLNTPPTWTLMGNVVDVDDPDATVAAYFEDDSSNTLTFVYHDGDGVKLKTSNNYGKTWVSV